MEGIERLRILRVTEEDKSEIEDMVVRESSLSIILNDRELETLLCTPTNLNHFAVGFIASKGWANFGISILGSLFSSCF